MDSSLTMEVLTKGGNSSSSHMCSPKGGNNTDSDDATILLSTPALSPYSTICYEDNVSLSLLSPASLKQNCLQVLSQNVSVCRPPSLYHVCVDFMAWNYEIYFNSSLVLPRSMNTSSQVVELRDFTPPHTENLNVNVPTQIIVYENLKVNHEVHEYWLQQAHMCKYCVSLPVLSAESIRLWCDPGSLDSWKNIDPYSDLEDIGCSSDKAMDSTESAPKSPSVKYKLRKRKLLRHKSMRPHRAASSNIVYYTESDSENLKRAKKRTQVKYTPSCGPSRSRIKSQNIKTGAPERTHRIPIVGKRKAETVSTPQQDSSDSDIPLSELRKTLETGKYDGSTSIDHDDLTPSVPRKKCVFVTKRVELRKYRRKRSYRCPVCKGKYETLGRLNAHYRDVHKKVKCRRCQISFTTPSTLSRHMYMHHEPRKFCRCGAGYYFNSELRIHKLTHRQIKSQFCQSPGCDKSYFSAADLAKHARTHLKINWTCRKCDYITSDERLLKSHQRVHDRIVKYTCQKCNKGFIFHTQWARHKKQDKC